MSEAAAASTPAAPSGPSSDGQQQPNAPKPHSAAQNATVGQVAAKAAASAAQPPRPGESSVAKPPEPPAPPKRYQLKRGNETVEVDEATLIARAQMGWDAHEKYQQAAQERKAREEREARLKASPWEVLKEYGHDPLKLSEQLILEQAQRQMMSPEEQQIAALKAEKAEWEAAKQRQAEQAEQQRLAAEARQYQQHYEQTFVAALGKSGIALDGSDPLAPWALQQMANLEALNAENEFNAPPEVLAEQLHESFARGAGLLLRGQSGDALLATLERVDPQLPQRLVGGLEGDALLSTLRRMDPDIVRRIQSAVIAEYDAGKRPVAPPKPQQQERQVNGTFGSRNANAGGEPEKKPEYQSSQQYWSQFRQGLKR